ncbi:MAG: spore coat protein [Terrisporobacter sp.]|uniref:spore coat protein n=1 Tax=Terrisporobacter sp. TaxID=1965305 RepID=UPI002FC8DE22
MVNLTNKEKFLLEGEKYQQQLAIDKYNDYSLQAQDSNLKNLFSSLSKVEQSHLDMVYEMLQGRIPQVNQGNLQPYFENNNSTSNNYINVGNITLSSLDSNFHDEDKIICFDALTTEELLHSTYSASSFEFEESQFKDTFCEIIKEKEDSLQYLNNYMIKKGMYNNTVYF